ncbi:MAG TPA: c-type cytochrome [Rhodocyclaceae bacterium]|nr:c-type cytochrome [Rhodocyclaceae bacterium]
MGTKAKDALKVFIALLVLQGRLALADPAAPAPSAELLAACGRCHQPEDSTSAPTAPHLDGQLRSYLVDSIDLLLAGKRPTRVENHLPPGLTRAQIVGLANHYSALRLRRVVDETDPDKVLRGEMIYMERCMACHADSGRETDNKGLGSPLLAGQRLAYLREQIAAYLTKQRQSWDVMKENAFAGKPLAINGNPVRDAIGPLGPADVDALANYFASVPVAAASGRRRR